MAVVRVDIEVNDKGEASVKKFSGALENAGGRAKGLQSVLQGIGQGLGQKLFDWASGLVGWLTKGAGAAVAWADKFGIVAAKMQTTAESAQKLNHIAEQTDAPLDAITGGLGKMQLALEKTPDAFTRLGIELDSFKKLKPEDQLAVLADKLNGIAEPSKRAEAARAVLGKGWMEMAPLLEAGGDKIRELAEETDRLGLSMNGGAIAAGRDMDDTLTKLNEVWEGFIRNIGAAIVTSEPMHVLLEGLVEILGSFSKGAQDGESTLRGFVDGGVIIAAQALVALVKAIGVAIDLWTALQVVVLGVAAAVKIQILWMMALAEATLHPTKALAIFQQATKDSATAISDAKKGIQDQIQANIDHHNKLIEVEVQTNKLAKAVSDADGATHKATETEKRRAIALGLTAEAAKKAEAAQKELAKIASKAGAAPFKDMGTDMWNSVSKSFMDAGKNGLGDAVTRIMADAGAFDAQPNSRIPDAMLGSADMWNQILRDRVAQARESLAAFTDSVLDGVQAVMDFPAAFAAATDSASRFRNALGGAKVGGQLGGQLGGIAEMLGVPGAGALGKIAGTVVGFIGGLFKSGAAKAREEAAKLAAELKKQTDDFANSYGGMDALKSKALEAHVSLDALFSAKSANALKKAISDIKDGLDTWAEANQRAQEAADRYGLSVKELGPAWAQQKLDESAAQLIGDWEILKAKGADMVAVTEKMAPAMNSYVQASLEAGTAVPENMRPMLEKMLEMGLLTDAAGNKLESLDGLSFTQSLTEGLSKAVDAINRLVDAMTGVQRVGSQGIRIPVSFDEQGDDPRSGNPRGAASGFFSPMLPSDMTIRAHRGERVEITQVGSTPLRLIRGGGGGNGGAGGDVHVGFNIYPLPHQNPREIAEEAAKILRNGGDGGKLRREVADVARAVGQRR